MIVKSVFYNQISFLIIFLCSSKQKQKYEFYIHIDIMNGLNDPLGVGSGRNGHKRINKKSKQANKQANQWYV